jgi:hypothetical protein
MNAKTDLPDKLIYRRSEVVKYTRLDGKVLDYWQREFGGFAPTVNQQGEMFYSRKDMDFIFKLKQWMVFDKIGKEKVKQKLAGEPVVKEVIQTVSKEIESSADREKLKIIRQSLEEILTILDKNDKK